jgi:hypothetical protein
MTDRAAAVEALARRFQDTYEQLASDQGGQAEELMRATVTALLDDGVIEVGPGLLAGFRPLEPGDLVRRWDAVHAR